MLKIRIIITILVASILQYYFHKPREVLHSKEVISAIKRAKTSACKREFEEFAQRVQQQESPQVLKRTCRLDSNDYRFQKVGCAINISNDIIKIEEHVENLNDCLEICFTFGHKFGGFESHFGSCYCGDLSLSDHNHNHTSVIECDQIDYFDWFQVNCGIHDWKKVTEEFREKPQENNHETRIAFLLILNGRSSSQIIRLLRNIYSNKHIYYMHVDSRDDHLFNDLIKLEQNYKNIKLTRKRFSTIWGGSELLEMMFDTFSYLIQYNWDYLINLSGSDFPIKPLRELEYYLRKNGNSNIYLKTHNIKGYNFIKKQALDHNFYQCEGRAWRLGPRRLPRGIVFYGGSDWFALPRDFCLYISNNLNEPNSLVKHLAEFFNYTLLPAESFFHTLALNSDFCDKFVDTNLRLTNWKRKGNCKCQHRDVVDWCGCSPSIYRNSDWLRLMKTNHSTSDLFFSRKFDPTVSMSIINEVETNLLERSQHNSKHKRLSYWRDLYYRDGYGKIRQEISFLSQFLKFCIVQSNKKNLMPGIQAPALELTSAYEYFDQDRFQGMILKHCDNNTCYQLLVTTNHHTIGENYCGYSLGQRLKRIEVNHGFDPGEKMFTNYLPLNHNSDLIVYNKWLIDNTKSNDSSNLTFSWIDPTNSTELKQTVKIRSSPFRSVYSLAHRSKLKVPLKAGLWTLKISEFNEETCLNYEFLVFDGKTFDEQSIDDELFGKFYSVMAACIDHHEMNNLSMGNCSSQDWSPSENRYPTTLEHVVA